MTVHGPDILSVPFLFPGHQAPNRPRPDPPRHHCRTTLPCPRVPSPSDSESGEAPGNMASERRSGGTILLCKIVSGVESW
jgi:hypothetical protein